MDWLRLLDLEKFLLFTLVLTRLSGLTITAPIYGNKDVPMQVRVFLAVALAMLIAPTQWNRPLEYPGTTLNYLVLVGSELLVGLCLGLGVTILFSGVQLAGGLVGRVGGLLLADVFDPNAEAEVPLFSRLMLLVTLAVFVCIGGHRILMAGLLDTFQTIPPGQDPLLLGTFTPITPDCNLAEQPVAKMFIELLTASFNLGIRAAVPVVTALLLSILVLGLIGRTLPQLNILMVGFGLNSMLAFATLSLTLGAAVWLFQDKIQFAINTVLEVLHTPLQTQWFS